LTENPTLQDIIAGHIFSTPLASGFLLYRIVVVAAFTLIPLFAVYLARFDSGIA